MITLRAFVGVFISKVCSTYSLLICTKQGQTQLEPVMIKSILDKKRVILIGLLDALRRILTLSDGKRIELIFYSGDPELEFEWNQEYLLDKAFAKSTDNIDLWNEITAIVKNNNINLTVKGDNTVLEQYNQKQKKRLKNGFKRTNK